MSLADTVPRTFASLAPGAIKFNRYYLLERIGVGACTEVWKVLESSKNSSGGFLALKLLSQTVAEAPIAADELQREASLTLNLNHPNILAAREFLTDEFEVGIVMDCAEASVSDLQRSLPHESFTPAELEPYVRQLSAGLAYLHRWGIIHRDIKPRNMLLFDGGSRLAISDFGISSVAGFAESRRNFCRPSGTIAYMSPQQLNAEPPSISDDIYSFGASLYELLTGKPPFYSGHIARQIETRVPDSIQSRRAHLGYPSISLPRQWEDVVMSCLEKDASLRPSSINDACNSLLMHEPATTRVARRFRFVRRRVSSSIISKPAIAVASFAAGLILKSII